MARPGRPERNRAARSFRQLGRFHHVINSNKVFGTHTGATTPCSSSNNPRYGHMKTAVTCAASIGAGGAISMVCLERKKGGLESRPFYIFSSDVSPRLCK